MRSEKSLRSRCSAVLLCLEAVEAQHRSSAFGLGAWLERNLARCAALGTRSGEHLARGVALLFALVATVLAALRSGEAALGVEGLLTLGEREWLAAIAAGDRLISHKKKEKKDKIAFVPSFLASSGYSDQTIMEGVCINIVFF